MNSADLRKLQKAAEYAENEGMHGRACGRYKRALEIAIKEVERLETEKTRETSDALHSL